MEQGLERHKHTIVLEASDIVIVKSQQKLYYYGDNQQDGWCVVVYIYI